MIYHQIVDLIKREPEKMAHRWGERVRRSEATKSYRTLSEEQLMTRHTRVFQNLALWLDQSLNRDQLGHAFESLGGERFHERIPLHEVNYALITAKRNFWELVRSQGLLNSALEFYQALELMSSIDLFFDLANYHIIRGYQNAQAADLGTVAAPSEEHQIASKAK